ncbi:MAG: entericidin A/B family lipoprotein [Rhodocyclaceae bacterium]|jgi:entericidin B
MLKKIVAPVLALMMIAITGCNTIEGAGKDIERGGEKVQSGAKNTKDKM